MFELIAAFLAGCAAICLMYYFLGVHGRPPDDPMTQPPIEHLPEMPEETHRKLRESIKR